ncbi:MAG TPA: PIN domain-containing protein [Thermoanaerobaculia bacterium]|nr:PIN domain-containing protein [Thermoanaerobaculia bacterium]
MPIYFVDTWFFIAFFHKRDPEHDAAMRLGRRLRESIFVTHDGVLLELLSFFSAHGDFWRNEVARFVEDAIAGRLYKVMPLSRELFADGLALYKRRLDKEYSLVDCASMVVMRQHGITTVLTNDHHFAQEGFALLNA